MFYQILGRMCQAYNVPFDKDGFLHLLRKWYQEPRRPMQPFTPRDIIKTILSICEYESIPPRMTPELIDEAWQLLLCRIAIHSVGAANTLTRSTMSTLLLCNARLLPHHGRQTPSDSRGALFVRDNVIERVGPTAELGSLPADRVIDARGKVGACRDSSTRTIIFTRPSRRAVPPRKTPCSSTGSRRSYPSGPKMDADAVYTSTLVGCAELNALGCTTPAHHLYIFQTAHGWTTKSVPPRKSASASTPAVAR